MGASALSILGAETYTTEGTNQSLSFTSISEIPEREIMNHAAGAIGAEFAQKYIDFLKMNKGNIFKMKEMFENPDYEIPGDIPSAAEMAEKVVNYIDSNYSTKNLPNEEYLINMFNQLNKLYPKTKDNYIKQVHMDILKKLFNKSTRDKLMRYFKMCDDRYQVNSD